MRSRRGFTLMELLIALIMAPIVLLAAAGIIVAEYNNYTIVSDNILASREAMLLTNHMFGILRYASSIAITSDAASTTITIDFPSGCLPYTNLPLSNNNYVYSVANRRVTFNGAILAWNVSGFTATCTDGKNVNLTITVTDARNRATVTMQTRIRLVNVP